MAKEKENNKKTAEKEKITEKSFTADSEKTKEIDSQSLKEKTSDELKKDHSTSQPIENEAKEKKEQKKQEVNKKREAVVNSRSLPISKKHAMYIGNFIKNRKIDEAISELQKVISLKKAIPFKGEIPHRRGKIERGRYPIKASKYFINALKGLKGNALTNQMELEDTKIIIVSPSWASRPLRRGGVKSKRVNLIIKAKEFNNQKKENK